MNHLIHTGDFQTMSSLASLAWRRAYTKFRESDDLYMSAIDALHAAEAARYPTYSGPRLFADNGIADRAEPVDADYLAAKETWKQAAQKADIDRKALFNTPAESIAAVALKLSIYIESGDDDGDLMLIRDDLRRLAASEGRSHWPRRYSRGPLRRNCR